MVDWGGAYGVDGPGGEYSGYWQVGKVVSREDCQLQFLRLGVLRRYRGQGVVQVSLWKEGEYEAVSLPLEVGGEKVGLLWLGGKIERAPLSLEELDHLVAISAQVAVSLLNAHLVQEIMDCNRRLQELARRVSSAREEERIRISRELHDGLLPYFLDILYGLDILELENGAGGALSRSMKEIRARTRWGLHELRRVISDLRPSSLEVLGLRDYLSSYLERFGAENGLEVEFECQGELETIDPLTEMTLFGVAQETLSKVVRHARAGRVRLALGNDNGQVSLEIEDDGVGFFLDDLHGEDPRRNGVGLRSMEEGAELAGGKLVVFTEPRRGATIRLLVPRPGAHGAWREERER